MRRTLPARFGDPEDAGPGRRLGYQPINLPHATWPHDLGMSEHYCVIHDLSMYFDPERLKEGQHRLHFHRNVPARFSTSREVK